MITILEGCAFRLKNSLEPRARARRGRPLRPLPARGGAPQSPDADHPHVLRTRSPRSVGRRCSPRDAPAARGSRDTATLAVTKSSRHTMANAPGTMPAAPAALRRTRCGSSQPVRLVLVTGRRALLPDSPQKLRARRDLPPVRHREQPEPPPWDHPDVNGISSRHRGAAVDVRDRKKRSMGGQGGGRRI